MASQTSRKSKRRGTKKRFWREIRNVTESEGFKFEREGNYEMGRVVKKGTNQLQNKGDIDDKEALQNADQQIQIFTQAVIQQAREMGVNRLTVSVVSSARAIYENQPECVIYPFCGNNAAS